MRDYKPPSPDMLIDARWESVHQDTKESRVARSVKVKKKKK